MDYSSALKDVILETEGGAGGLTYRYVYGLDKVSVAMSGELSGSGNLNQNGQVKLWYHHDHLGTTDFLTDNVSGKVTSYVTYDDWGALTAKAIVKMGVRELDLVQEYTGHPYDMVLGVYFAEARMYDATDRRFMAEDLLKGNVASIASLDRYVYVINNPLIFVDPTGLITLLMNGQAIYSETINGQIYIDPIEVLELLGYANQSSAEGRYEHKFNTTENGWKNNFAISIATSSASISPGTSVSAHFTISGSRVTHYQSTGNMYAHAYMEHYVDTFRDATPLRDGWLLSLDYFKEFVCPKLPKSATFTFDYGRRLSSQGKQFIKNEELTRGYAEWHLLLTDDGSGIYPYYVGEGGITLGFGHYISPAEANKDASEKALMSKYGLLVSMFGFSKDNIQSAPGIAPYIQDKKNKQKSSFIATPIRVPNATSMTWAEADALFEKDVADYEDALNAFLNKHRIDLTFYQYDMALSISYNLGKEIWNKPDDWSIVRMIRDDYPSYNEITVSETFNNYVNKERRAREASVFNYGY